MPDEALLTVGQWLLLSHGWRPVVDIAETRKSGREPIIVGWLERGDEDHLWTTPDALKLQIARGLYPRVVLSL